MENTTIDNEAPNETKATVKDQKLDLKNMPKEERKSLREKIIDMIRNAGAIRTREIANALGASYSQIYLPLRRVPNVAEAYGDDRKMYWIALKDDETPADNVPVGMVPVARKVKPVKVKADKVAEPLPEPKAKAVKKKAAPAKKAAPKKKAAKPAKEKVG